MSGNLAAFACGVILLYTFPMLPPLPWLIAAAFPLVWAALHIQRLARLAVLLLSVLTGVTWASWHASDRLQQVLPASLEGQVVSVSGYLCNIPAHGSFNSLRFNFCITHWHRGDSSLVSAGELPRTVRLAWYGNGDKRLPGHRLRLDVVLKKPHGAMNPAGFRYETWLFRKGFRATGTVRDVAEAPAVSCTAHCQYAAWRLDLADSLASVMGEAEHYPLLASLLMGHRGAMTAEHWAVLKATGTIHLVAISGLHLGLVAIGAGFLARRLITFLPAGYPAPQRQRYLVLGVVAIACLLYALAAGFTVPTRRALIMVLVAGWIWLKGRQVSAWHGLALALFLVVLTDPFAPLDQGFWLSFGAVSVLVLVFAGRLAPPRWLAALALAQAAVFVGLWPILSVLDQGQPYSGLLANLFAIPWVSFVVMPLLMAGTALVWCVPGSRDAVLLVFDGALEVLWGVLNWLASLALPDSGADVGLAAAMAFLVLLVLMVPAPRLRMVLLFAGALLLGASSIREPLANPWVEQVEMRVWDVGQGLSVLIRHHDQVLLYDTGPAVPGVFSSVESVLIPNFRRLGIRRIDTLVISHADSDHAGGLSALFAAYPVGEVISGEPERLQALDGGYGGPVPAACKSSPPRTIAGVRVQFWQGDDADQADNSNDLSCVVIAMDPGRRFQVILPGDITAAVERAMIVAPRLSGSRTSEPTTRIVMAPHHGSNTSSTISWVEALAPDWVIYSAGYRHRFGHPHSTVVDRYHAVGSRQLNTAYSGAVRLVLDDTGVRVDQQRATAPFWIRGPITDW